MCCEHTQTCIPGPYMCVHMYYMYMHVSNIVDTHTFRFCTAKFHTHRHQFTKVVLEQFHNIVTNVANSYRLPPGPTERERERKAGRKAGRKGGREEATHKCYDVGRAAWALCPDVHE